MCGRNSILDIQVWWRVSWTDATTPVKLEMRITILPTVKCAADTFANWIPKIVKPVVEVLIYDVDNFRQYYSIIL